MRSLRLGHFASFLSSISARRLFSLREIVTTERTYADSLQLLQKGFVEQVPIPDDEKKQLFAPLDPIRDWHLAFAAKLEVLSQCFADIRFQAFPY